MSQFDYQRLIIVTGAGISAPSGLATFRGQGGIWQHFDMNRVCSLNAFFAAKNNPTERSHIFSFYQQLHQASAQAQPNEAHYVCAQLQRALGSERCMIFTTNIDDLHQRAAALQVVHLHGDLQHMLCAACSYTWKAPLDSNARCPHCESTLTKPQVVFFHEHAPNYTLLDRWMHPKRSRPDDVLLVIGSSLQVVGTDRLLRYDRYHTRRVHNILLNKDPTDFDSQFSMHLLGDCTQTLPQILPWLHDHFGMSI